MDAFKKEWAVREPLSAAAHMAVRAVPLAAFASVLDCAQHRLIGLSNGNAGLMRSTAPVATPHITSTRLARVFAQMSAAALARFCMSVSIWFKLREHLTPKLVTALSIVQLHTVAIQPPVSERGAKRHASTQRISNQGVARLER
jgi:hypothetical protein